MNKFIISGRITKDLALESTRGGTPVTMLNLAENFSYTDKNGDRQSKTNFFRITAYGETAKNAVKYCGKGSTVLVEARIENDNYEKDGKTVYKDNIIAIKIEYSALKAPGSNGTVEQEADFQYDPETLVE